MPAHSASSAARRVRASALTGDPVIRLSCSSLHSSGDSVAAGSVAKNGACVDREPYGGRKNVLRQAKQRLGMARGRRLDFLPGLHERLNRPDASFYAADCTCHTEPDARASPGASHIINGTSGR